MEDTTAQDLKNYVVNIEKLENEKKDIQNYIRDVYGRAAAEGFDVKVIRQIIKLRKMDDEDREEQETLLDLYKRALGMHCEE